MFALRRNYVSLYVQMGKMTQKEATRSSPSKGAKWYNVLLFVLFLVVLFVVGMFWIGPW